MGRAEVSVGPEPRPAPSRPPGRRDIPGLVGTLGVLTLAATVFTTESLHQYALAFCLCAVAASREDREALRADPVFRFALVFALYLAAQTGWGIFLFPETTGKQIQDFGRWLSILGFIPVACLLRGEVRWLNALLMIAAIGSWVRVLQLAYWRWGILRFNTGSLQAGFGMEPSASGLVSAAVLLGLALLSVRVFDACRRRRWWFGLSFPLLAAGFYLSAYRLVASQARTAWVALFLVLLATLGFQLAARRRAFRPLLGMTAVVLAILAGGIASNAESILARIGPDRDEFAALLKGGTDPTRVSSLGARFQAQKFGVEKWLERPLLGWGTGSTRHLIQSSGRPELRTRPGGPFLAHLHNFVLEVLVRFGLLGAGIFVCGGWILIRRLSQAELRRRMPEDLFLFLLGAVAMAAISALTGLHVLNEHWRYFWFIAMGGLYTFVLWPGTGSARPEASAPIPGTPA